MTTDAGEAVAEGRQYRQFRFALLPTATEIILVRHGETVPLVAGQTFDLVDGQGDPGLGAEGREQAERVADRLQGEAPIDAIYVTTLRRTRETAEPLAARLGLDPVVEPDLREIGLGEWEGGAYRQHVAEGHPLAIELIEKERWDVVPGAESNEAFAERLREAIARIGKAHRGRRVVAVSHGGAIGMILSLATGSRPFAFVGSDNGSISRIVVDDNGWMVRGFNEVSHLT